MILRKLKIMFKLQSEDILEILDLADMPTSKHELSASLENILKSI